MKKRLVPEMTTDEEAEAFLDQDLSDLDLAAFRPLARDGRDGRAGVRSDDAHDAAMPRRHPRA